jgi:hypothetical protein
VEITTRGGARVLYGENELEMAFDWNANQLLNNLATSKGSSHARRRRKPSCASMSEQVWMYLTRLCNKSTSVWRASVLCRMDVKREVSGSTSYSQAALFLAQRAHEGRWPSHCSMVRAKKLMNLSEIAWFTLVLGIEHRRLEFEIFRAVTSKFWRTFYSDLDLSRSIAKWIAVTTVSVAMPSVHVVLVT